MIQKETVDKIIDAARIEEVVGEFVSLKKRGSSMIGLCPFHNEKSPSFNVSPARGIYKCFGCSKAGNSVNFLMEHDHLSYPDALRWLANKYNIEVLEDEKTDVQIQANNERESLFVINSFAQKYYTINLHETESGKAIGLSYFKERGFTEETIQKFQLGFSNDSWDGLTNEAITATYSKELLIKSGLSIQGEKQDKLFDRFRGRVIFPIHNSTGRVIGFGGRVMGAADKKTAKYINSPETDIYHKSQVLYGLNFAKKSIIKNDTCYLVEGYTDVISLHQNGIENVVSSSGTSLTPEQISAIKRFTKNIVILYDGDMAGIKASFRGIDMILAEGMNVRVVLFPDGDDPDSYAKKVSNRELVEFLTNNSKDFISFKTGILVEETANDPIKRASLIHEIVSSIAIIPDAITRTVYIETCSKQLKIDQEILLKETNKKIGSTKSVSKAVTYLREQHSETIPKEPEVVSLGHKVSDRTELSELNILTILLHEGGLTVPMAAEDENGQRMTVDGTLADFIINEIEIDAYPFMNHAHQLIITEYISQYSQGVIVSVDHFINHSDKTIRDQAMKMLWYDDIGFTDTKDEVKKSFDKATATMNACKMYVALLNLDRVDYLIKQIQDQLPLCNEEEQVKLLEEQNALFTAKRKFSKDTGRVIIN